MRWVTRHKAITTNTIEEMESELDEICKENFVVATQIFNSNGKWSSMVYYRVKTGE